MNEVISTLIELLFTAVFVATAWSYLRTRDPLSRDVMLVFATVTVLFVVSLVRGVVGTLPAWVSIGSVAFLLAQPLLVLRVCVRTGDVRRAVWWGALAAYVLTVLPLFLLPADGLEAWMVLPAIAVFVATEAIAAWSLARAGVQRTGAARARLLIAAGATALFGLALLGLGVTSGNEALSEAGGVIARALGLLAGIGYVLAFLPIGWLRRVWKAAAGFEFTQSLIGGPPSSVEHPWQRLLETAKAITGARRVALVLTAADGSRSVIGEVTDRERLQSLAGDAEVAELAAAAEQRREMPAESWTRVGEALAEPADHSVLSALAFETVSHGGGLLAWITPRRSLFADDDRELLEILCGRAAVFADRAATHRTEAALNQRLAATNDALARASEAKSDFLASMSHELRTPLATIIGFSSLMRDEPGDAEAVRVPREWVEHVHSSGEHLLGLINDVLDLSKVEAGRLELELHRFDLATAVVELIGGMRPLADRKQIMLVADVPSVEVVADRGRMRQILYNLVSNAVKFTSPGGRVSLSAERDGDGVRLTVADTGVGIAPEDHDRVFREFQQVGDAASRQAGTGLGLALTRRLVEAHAGRIELESALGEGSRFTVILPDAGIDARTDAAVAPSRSGSAAAPPDDGDHGDILLVEDDPSAVRLIRTYLENAGHRLRVCADGETGLAEARRAPPTAILLDVLLPGKDGWDVLRELKADERLRDVPVVVVSAVDERQLGLTLGAVDYFLKPVDRDALLARLARYTYTTKVRHQTVRVLAIDDDPTALAMVDGALTPAGFEVVLAASGREGIERARQGGIDLVICDLLMPDLDGFEVVQQLRADPDTAELPILILTAHNLTAADKQRLNGHILGVVSKDGELRAELERWIMRAIAAARAAIGPA